MEQKKGVLYKCKKPLKKNTTKKPLKKKTPRIKQFTNNNSTFSFGLPNNIGTRDGEWMRKDDISSSR
jgi:hypothetical protein